MERLRFLLFAVFFVSAVGTGVELFLLEHTETVWQLVPFAALAAGMLCGAAAVVRPRAATIRTFQAAMAALVASGLAGLYLHYRGNVEFELEMYPSLRGAELVWKALTGATPALAPGVLLQLGVLGLLACIRHPALPAGAAHATRTFDKRTTL